VEFSFDGWILKQTAQRRDNVSEKIYYTLSIPNKEVRATYTGIIDRYFPIRSKREIGDMLKSLLEGDSDVSKRFFPIM